MAREKIKKQNKTNTILTAGIIYSFVYSRATNLTQLRIEGY